MSTIKKSRWTTAWVATWMSDWANDWVIESLIEWMRLIERVTESVNETDWATYWTSHWLSHWLNDWVSHRLSEWLSDWMGERVTEWASAWLSEWVTDWMIEQVTDRMSDCVTHWISERAYVGTYMESEQLIFVISKFPSAERCNTMKTSPSNKFLQRWVSLTIWIHKSVFKETFVLSELLLSTEVKILTGLWVANLNQNAQNIKKLTSRHWSALRNREIWCLHSGAY